MLTKTYVRVHISLSCYGCLLAAMPPTLAAYAVFLCTTLTAQTVVIEDMAITAYYAGHVLGAALFHVAVGSQSVVYTVLHSSVSSFVSVYSPS